METGTQKDGHVNRLKKLMEMLSNGELKALAAYTDDASVRRACEELLWERKQGGEK